MFGINSNQILIGPAGALSSTHTEDGNLGSLNVIIKGKKWWGFICIKERLHSPFYDKDSANVKLEKAVAGALQDPLITCDYFMKTKEYAVPPDFCEQHGIDVISVIQESGVFIYTVPYAYHTVLTMERTISSAINFYPTAEERFNMDRDNICKCHLVRRGKINRQHGQDHDVVHIINDGGKIMEKYNKLINGVENPSLLYMPMTRMVKNLNKMSDIDALRECYLNRLNVTTNSMDKKYDFSTIGLIIDFNEEKEELAMVNSKYYTGSDMMITRPFSQVGINADEYFYKIAASKLDLNQM